MPKQKVMEILEKVKIIDSKTVGKIMSAWGIWKAGNNAAVQAHKALVYQAELKNLERCDGFWRTPDCKSEWKEHAQFLTTVLADVLSHFPDTLIYREHFIPEVGLRPDAIILKINDGYGSCVVLEAVMNETDDYFNQKVNVWKQWQGANEYLSRLFNYRIKSFVVLGKKSNAVIKGLNVYESHKNNSQRGGF